VDGLSWDKAATKNREDAMGGWSGIAAAAPIGSSLKAFDAKIYGNSKRWTPIIKAAGMKAE
jgi:hypothetical protein